MVGERIGNWSGPDDYLYVSVRQTQIDPDIRVSYIKDGSEYRTTFSQVYGLLKDDNNRAKINECLYKLFQQKLIISSSDFAKDDCITRKVNRL